MKQGWTYKKLGDICEVTDFVANGSFATLKQNVTYYDVPNFAILVRLADYSSNFDSSKFVYVDEHAYNFLAKSKLYGGEVIMSNVGSIGKCFLCPILDKPMTIGPNSLLIRTPNNRFYLYYFRSETFIKDLHSITSSATLSKFNKTQLKTLSLPVPSPAEQERIVERLDAVFAQIDELKSNAEKQLAEARALFQSALTQAMQPKAGWQETTIGDICEIERGKRFVRADIVDDGVPCVHYGDIYTQYGLSVTKTKGCLKPELAKKMRFAKKNDVVVVQAGENNWDIGVGVAYFGEEPAAVHDACFILRHKQDPMFISYYLRSYNYHWYLLDYVHEGKICSFLKPALEKAPIPLPPLSEQQSIVATLDSLKSKVDHLQENYKKISQECDAMKQALLRQIFE